MKMIALLLSLTTALLTACSAAPSDPAPGVPMLSTLRTENVPAPSGAVSYFTLSAGSGQSPSENMLALLSGTCVLQKVSGNVQNAGTRVWLGVVGSGFGQTWTLNLTAAGSDSFSATAACAPWSMFYGNVPSYNQSQFWTWTVSGATRSSNLWGNPDSYCSLTGLGGTLGALNGHIPGAQSIVYQNGASWLLSVNAAAGDTCYGEATCFSFSQWTGQTHPTFTTTPNVDQLNHTQALPFESQALCGLADINPGGGGIVAASGIAINPAVGTITNNRGFLNEWPIGRATCINYQVN